MADIRECRHIMPSGLHCQSPAMRGSAFCYFHGRAPRPARPARIPESNLEMPSIHSPGAIIGALDQIIQALAANRISARRAAVLLQGVQMAFGQPMPPLPMPGDAEPMRPGDRKASSGTSSPRATISESFP